MEEASCTTAYTLPGQDLLEEDLKQCENPHFTYETLVLRVVKRLLLKLHLPWSHVLDTVRQEPCLLDEKLHDKLRTIRNRRKQPVTSQLKKSAENLKIFCRFFLAGFGRVAFRGTVLGHDRFRVADMIKWASVLHNIADLSEEYYFFAVDELLGDDPKRYVDVLWYGPEDVQYHHVAEVRFL
ncbi:hypothetical protein AVEN_110149-1 [Araneus ventricosus]|uniref:Uncharacterized protein n=1 Tax=Araneus ventricosus TaxID=182803 RepID=A0A4Y2J370_ARAVE|nr:hypothetical protein AVEN_110149-1 [Araneus ventricosus]